MWSITHALTGEKKRKEENDTRVKSVFHELIVVEEQRLARLAAEPRSGSLTDPPPRPGSGNQPTQPGSGGGNGLADPQEVVEFFRAQASEIRNNPSISEAKRRQWGAKLDQAVREVRAGKVPTLAVFGAWQRMRQEAQLRTGHARHARLVERAETGGGAAVTREDVAESVRLVGGLRADLRAHPVPSTAVNARAAMPKKNPGRNTQYSEVGFHQMRRDRLAMVTAQCQELVRLYDASPQGQADLASGASADFDAVFDGGRGERAPHHANTITPLASVLREYLKARNRARELHSSRSVSAEDKEHAKRKHARQAEALNQALAGHPQWGVYKSASHHDLATGTTWQELTRHETTTEDKAAVAEAYLLAYRADLKEQTGSGLVSEQQAGQYHAAARQAAGR